MNDLKTTPTSKLIYNMLTTNQDEFGKEMSYVRLVRLKNLDMKDKETLIMRDERIIKERGLILNNYLLKHPTLEETLELLFTNNMINKLTFSEQILSIEIMKKIINLLKLKEKLSIKEINRKGRLLEHSILSIKSNFKTEYLQEECDNVLAYWNELNKLEKFYMGKRKKLQNEINYILGLEEDILNSPLRKIAISKIIMKNETKIMKNELEICLSTLDTIKSLELMSEKEKETIKQLKRSIK